MRCLLSLLLLFAVAVAVPALGATRERTGPDSFLQWRANTVDEFMAQYDRDPVLRKRLAKHFHVSEAELGSYLRANLRVVTVRESGWVTTYGVTRTGRIYKARDYLHRGAKEFGLPDGTLLLKLPCGNPLLTELPSVTVAVQPTPLPPVSEIVEQPLVVAPPEELPPPVQAPEEFALLTEAPRAPLITPALAQPLESRRSPWWLPLAFLPAFGDHHIIPPPPPIPEPNSLVYLLTGTVALCGWASRRRGRRGSA